MGTKVRGGRTLRRLRRLRGLRGLRGLRRLRGVISFLIGLLPVWVMGQELPKDVCRIEDGKLVFQLDPRWTEAQRNQVVKQFNLDSTLISEILKGMPSIVVNGVTWDAKKITGGLIELTNAVGKLADIGRIQIPVLMLNDQWPGSRNQIQADGPSYGVNKFTKPDIFSFRDSLVILNLPGYSYAKSVFLSGNFNDWSTGKTPMTKTENGWTIMLKLGPGHYPYKYIIDGRWTQDPNNKNREDDLNGGNNSVFYCYNYTFRLNGYTDARKVILAGSFNGFNPKELEMIKSDKGWNLPMFLKMGTWSYKFIVDGRWMTDPENPVIRGDGRGNQNSFIGFGDSTLFRLEEYAGARQVELAGSFNNWQWGELIMEKSASGWQLPYALGPGNYEYKYIVDGRWITDPTNPYISGSGDQENSFMAFNPTHTFVLDTYPDAKQVILSGSFNGWREDGYRMARKDGHWTFPIWLMPGKYTYKFIVNGKWITDPANPLWEPNETGTNNSVVWVK